MSVERVRRRKILIFVLAIAMVSSVIIAYSSDLIASSTRTSEVTGNKFTAESYAGLDLNATLLNNSLYGENLIANPGIIFKNITSQINISAYFGYVAGDAVNVFSQIEIRQILYSSTTPPVHQTVECHDCIIHPQRCTGLCPHTHPGEYHQGTPLCRTG